MDEFRIFAVKVAHEVISEYQESPENVDSHVVEAAIQVLRLANLRLGSETEAERIAKVAA